MYTIIACLLFLGCSDTKEKKKDKTSYIERSAAINKNADSVFLNLCYKFKAEAIELENSFSKEFKDFLLQTDTTALKQQPNFKLSVIILLEKLYLHHLSCCNQGYNLIDMDGNNAKFITNAFVEFAKLNLGYDNFLNSGYVYEYVQQNQSTLTNKELSIIHDEITKQIKRLEKKSD